MCTNTETRNAKGQRENQIKARKNSDERVVNFRWPKPKVVGTMETHLLFTGIIAKINTELVAQINSICTRELQIKMDNGGKQQENSPVTRVNRCT